MGDGADRISPSSGSGAARARPWARWARNAFCIGGFCLACGACGSSSRGALGTTTGTRDAGADTATLLVDAGGSDARSGGSSEGGTADTGVLSFGDSSSSADQSSACTQLNIGILGNPGQNPSSDFQAWLVSAGTSVQTIQNVAPTATLTAATLQPFDVVILDWLTRDYTAAEAAVFAAFVSAGGGVVSMSGYDNDTTDDWHANSLLAPLEIAYAEPFIENGPVTDFAASPITMGITSVTFDGGYAIADLGGTASTRTPIGFLPNPDDAGTVPVAYAVQMGSGHAFVWGDEWISFDSEWSTMPQIQQLWVQVFAWIAPANKCGLMPPQ